MIPVHFQTGTSTPVLTMLKGGTQSVDFYGLSATNAETATVIYFKLWWQGNSNTAPVLGVTAPDITIAIPSNGVWFCNPRPTMRPGLCYYAVTKLQADTDATALSTGGEAVTIFIE